MNPTITNTFDPKNWGHIWDTTSNGHHITIGDIQDLMIGDAVLRGSNWNNPVSDDNPINEIYEDNENGQLALIDWTSTHLDSLVVGFRYIGVNFFDSSQFFYIGDDEPHQWDDYEFFQEFSYVGYLDENEEVVLFEDEECEMVSSEGC